MAKEIDDLLRDVFGSGKSRTISTQRAETYLEQSRKMNAGLDALNRKQENLNQKLQNQLEELKKMSGELDFDAIQKEVEKDFGVTYQPDRQMVIDAMQDLIRSGRYSVDLFSDLPAD